MNNYLSLIMLAIALSISVLLNIYLIIITYRKSNTSKINKDLALLSDLMDRDRAIIEIRRIAPQHMFIRSPKDIAWKYL